MAYQYSPRALDDEEELKRPALQPEATLPTPAANGDPFRRNVTPVEGNTETRYGAVAPTAAPAAIPTRAATPDAFARPPQLLVPSPAIANVPAPGGPSVEIPTAAPSITRGVRAELASRPGAPLATGATAAGLSATVPTSVAVPPAAPPVVTPTPFPGTLPGATPQPSALPVAPRPILEDDEDAFRRRRSAIA